MALLAYSLLCFALATPLCAQGVSGRATAERDLSSYEQESLEFALSRVQGQRDTEPEGKRVESIQVVSLDVIEPRDPAPDWLNLFHVTTRPSVIDREVLVRPGQRYEQKLIDETERNLREFSQLSVVLVVAVKGSRSGQVRILVVTKDVWSLRVNWEPSFFNNKLTSLVLQPSEGNLFGTTHSVAGRLTFSPNYYWLGGSYYAPRIGGSRISAYATASAGFSCKTGRLQGTQGVFQYGQPLYSSRSKWSWQTAMAWHDLIQQPQASAGKAICTGEDARTTSVPFAAPQTVSQSDAETGSPGYRIWRQREVFLPYRYRDQSWRSQIVITRSFFELNKLDVSVGAESDTRAYTTLPVTDSRGRISTYVRLEQEGGIQRRLRAEEVSVSADEASAALTWFRYNALPLYDRRISPYAQLHAYRSSYQPIINYQTLGLQEAYQAGHNVYLRLYPAFRPLSSRSLLGTFAGASYALPVGNGFIQVLGTSEVELALPGNDDALQVVVPDSENGMRRSPYAALGQRAVHSEFSGAVQSDAEFKAGLHIVTPDLGAGRFVSNVALTTRPTDGYLLRFESVLGGTDQLRGYQASAFAGRSRLAANTEFRTRPLRVMSVLAGLSLFWDAGDAADTLDELRLKHGAGVGLRVLFPQLDRQVFRIDFGLPLQTHEKGEFSWFAGFARVFETPNPRPPSLLSQ